MTRPLPFKALLILTFLMSSCQIWGQTQNRPLWTAEMYAKTDAKAFAQFKPALERINFTAPDKALLNAAIFYETNVRRVAAGLPVLTHAAALERAAQAHSAEMVALNYFSHESPTPGRKTFIERLALEGVNLGYRGENIAKGFGLEYESGRSVFPPETSGAGFRYAIAGPDILPHTYLGAAKALLDQWMNSPKHKANILNPKFTYLGCGATAYKAADFYHMDYLMGVQNFSSYAGN